jgi:predicted DNA-binding transcriptional regulator AlpA
MAHCVGIATGDMPMKQPSLDADFPPTSVPLPRSEKLRDTFALLSEEDLGALIGVDPRTLTVWRCQKRGPDVVKLGRAIFYRREDVDAWIALNVAPMDRAMSA